MRMFALYCVLLAFASAACAATLVDIPLDQQIDTGMGPAISGHTSFGSDAGEGYVRRDLTMGNGGGSWYFGPYINLAKAGYAPYVDLSYPGTQIEYTTRYFQGDGNTNPYADCNVMMQLIDVNGRARNLGMSYGPQPDPHYPEWVTCTDGTDVEGAPDPLFDITQVVAIEFFGTDWNGVGNDFVEIRDLMVYDSVTYDTIRIGQAKTSGGGQSVVLDGVVTAVLPNNGMFYVEELDRTSGIQVRCAEMPAPGSRVYVPGYVCTDVYSNELYIDCERSFRNLTGSVGPLCLNSRALGGSQLGLQCGVVGGQGLNNIGLLVRLTGKVIDCADDFSWAIVSDGHDTGDGEPGVYVDLSGVPFWERPTIILDEPAIVTGVSSLTFDQKRMIRVSSASGLTLAEDPGNEPKTVRVAVINFDPYCPGYDGLTHEVCGFNDPGWLADDYIWDLMNCSGNFARYEIVSWFDADYFPHFEDGFQFDPDEWVDGWLSRSGFSHPGTTDYVRLITDPDYPHNQPITIAERIAIDEIDEVFMFGPPYACAYWEAAMAGPSPFFVNGGTYTIPESGRNFVLMGFNYERGVDCMLEDFCHRTECTMSLVYPSPDWWLPTYPPVNNWEAFRMYDQRGPGHAACGICHFAPNSESDYDWGNTNYVWSTCDDWLYNWPNLVGDIAGRWVNCEEWGNGDMREHHIWWLDHLPKAQGINPDGKQNNWWKYVLDFASYPESR